MAELVLGIRLTADGKGLVGEVRIAKEELDKLGQGAGQAASQASKLNNESQNLGASLAKTATAIGLSTAAFIQAADAIIRLASYVKDYVKEAALLNARHETLGVVMNVVGRNAGYAGGEMQAYAEGVRKMGITMIESRQSVISLAQAQIDLSLASKLARAAQDAAVLGGINSSEALQRMIYGIQSGQTEVLRTIGINVNFEDSYKKLAAQLHRNVASLTEAEKAQARANAVLEATARILGAYEEAMGTAGKQITSLARYEEDLKVLRGQVFNEALVIAVNAYTDSLKDANQEARRLTDENKLQEWGRDMVRVFAWVGDIVVTVFETFRQVVESAAVTTLRSMQFLKEGALRLFPGGQILKLLGVDSGLDEYVKAFEDRANERLAARLGRKQFRTSAEEFFEQKDTDAARRAQRELMEAFTGVPAAPAAQAAGAVGKINQAYQSLIKTIRERIAVAVLDLSTTENLTEGQKLAAKVMEDLQAGTLKLTRAQKIARVADLERLIALEKANQAQERARKEAERLLDARIQGIASLNQEIEAQRKHNEEIGLSAEALAALGQTRLDDAIAIKERELAIVSATSADEVHIKAIEIQIDRLNELKRLRGEGAAKDVAVKQAEDAREAWKRTNEDINRSLTDALLRGFESGKDFARNFRDTLVNMFKTLVLRPIIQWIISPISGAITATLGGLGIPGVASAAGGGGGSLLNLGSNFLSSGIGSAIFGSAGAYSTALGLGSSAVGSQAALLAAQTGVFGLSGLAATAGSAGAASAGFLSALGPIGLGVGALGLLGAFGSRGGGPAHWTGGEFIGTAGAAGVEGTIFGTSANQKQKFRWEIPGRVELMLEPLNQAAAGAFEQMRRLGEMLGRDVSVLQGFRAQISFQGLGARDTENTIDAFRANIGQITDQLAMQLMPNLRNFAQANETATQTLMRLVQVQEQLRVSETQIGGTLAGMTRGLPAQLGIPGLESARDALRVAEFHAPLERFASARELLGATYGRAIGGDLGAVQSFPQLLQQALTIGRDVFASGPQFQELFLEGNRQLQDVLGRQQALQTEILADVPVIIQQAAQDQIGELRRGFKAVVDELTAVKEQLRQLREAA